VGGSQYDRPLPRPDSRHRFKGEGTPARPEQAAAADDDLVGAVRVPLVPHVVEPADLFAAACDDPITVGGGKEAAAFSLGSETPLGAFVPASLWHGGKG